MDWGPALEESGASRRRRVPEPGGGLPHRDLDLRRDPCCQTGRARPLRHRACRKPSGGLRAGNRCMPKPRARRGINCKWTRLSQLEPRTF
ncbi:uncharacterized protein KIAA0040 homolog isoform X2 [Panthera uncia]|uniref:uncharacterized protein KIAA0040 homolog isoform X2 n=1 Tax=Panthera uncia TaxID=29064 RepID=UPI0020FFA0C8|nr:uncharacterized protein KIAA0040 homolog isoform X2 [Panthera uncia]